MNGTRLEGFYRIQTDSEWNWAQLDELGENDAQAITDDVIIHADSPEEAKAKMESILFTRFPSPDPRLVTWKPNESSYHPRYERGLFLEKGHTLATAIALAKKHGTIKTSVQRNYGSFEPYVDDGVAVVCERDAWRDQVPVIVSTDEEFVQKAKRRGRYMKSSSPIRSWMADLRRETMYHLGYRICQWCHKKGPSTEMSHWGRNNLDQVTTFLHLFEGVKKLYGETDQQVMEDLARDFWGSWRARNFRELESRKKNSMLLVAKTAKRFFKTKEERAWAARVSWYFRKRWFGAQHKKFPSAP